MKRWIKQSAAWAGRSGWPNLAAPGVDDVQGHELAVGEVVVLACRAAWKLSASFTSAGADQTLRSQTRPTEGHMAGARRCWAAPAGDAAAPVEVLTSSAVNRLIFFTR